MAKKSRAAKKTEALRASLWPDLDPSHLWSRHTDDGYTSIPRTLPIIMSIIDDLTKGKPASAAYFELWCRAFDEMYVSLGAAAALATHSGYSGQRAIRMWQERIESLDKLGFIRTKEGSAGRLSHAVILNPHLVIKALHDKKHPGVTKEKYAALVERATETGSDDFQS
ncbi:hypothetical protein [Mesorhizobium sp. CA5]|uniref:hypothetical protein n=1 Tax=Mesorhizobium sp. CA5 TaxID=2876638 RepID=UPI001CD15B63|nr:hypothetical protein [Mesorhizobium sp. CA5]MBZ9843984.1 hypothetical protein [Mesorhizobium sp. CA5]